MIKIFFKALILVFIILSIYFIVNPSACSNLLMGRVVNSAAGDPAENLQDRGELFVPAGDPPLPEGAAVPSAKGIFDTNSLKAQQNALQGEAAYSQEDLDYVVATRYVELENEYAQRQKIGKDTAKEISYMVMDAFELSPEEWEAFLERATKSNLFDQIRSEQFPKQKK